MQDRRTGGRRDARRRRNRRRRRLRRPDTAAGRRPRPGNPEGLPGTDQRRRQAVGTTQSLHARPVTARDPRQRVPAADHVQDRRTGRRRDARRRRNRRRRLRRPDDAARRRRPRPGNPESLPGMDQRRREAVDPPQSVDRRPVAAGDAAQRVAAPDHVKRDRVRGRGFPAAPGRQPLHVIGIGRGEHRHVVMRRTALGRRFDQPPGFQRKQHALQPGAAAPGGAAEVDGHAGGMDGTVGGVAGLVRMGPRQARHHQLLAARPAILRRQPLDEQPHRGPRERKRHVGQGVVGIPRDGDEITGVDEAAQLPRVRQQGEVVPPGLGDLAVDRRAASAQALGRRPARHAAEQKDGRQKQGPAPAGPQRRGTHGLGRRGRALEDPERERRDAHTRDFGRPGA